MRELDIYGFINVKPCIDQEPSGNDGPIVSSYGIKLGFSLDFEKINAYFRLLPKHPLTGLPTRRLPYKEIPFPSRDSMLGWKFLKLITLEQMIAANWKFSPIQLPPFNPVKLIIQLYKLRGKHRNTFWKEKGYEQVYHVAFMVPYTDRGFYYRNSGKAVPYHLRLIEWIDKKIKPSNSSSALIRYLKYDIMPEKNVWESYFSKEHPYCKKLRGEQ